MQMMDNDFIMAGDNFIDSHKRWEEEYLKDRYKIWIRAILSDGRELYLPEHRDWVRLKYYCESNHLSVTFVKLQYKSHIVEVDVSEADAVYIIRSLIGQWGADSKHCYTVGKLINGIVHKKMWLTPELVEDQTVSDEDPVENCFEEALIYNHEYRKAK